MGLLRYCTNLRYAIRVWYLVIVAKYLWASVGIVPTWWVFAGRHHCCLICAYRVSCRGGRGYIRKALEKGYLEHPGSACCTDDMFDGFIPYH